MLLDVATIFLIVATIAFVRANERGNLNTAKALLLVAAWIVPMLFFGFRAIVVWFAAYIAVGFILVVRDFFSKRK